MKRSPEKVRLSLLNAHPRMSEGYGCQVDSHIFSEKNAYTKADFAEWLARIDNMGLQSARVQVFPEWYEREIGKFEFDTLEMLRLFSLLDMFEERGIKVDLSFYGCNGLFRSLDGKYVGSPFANTFKGNWITAPKLHEGGVPFDGYGLYAQAVSALLSYILDVKKYTCVYEYSIFPEPNCSFFNENGECVDEEFIEFYKVVDERLAKDGVKGRIICSGPGDCANDPERYVRYAKGLKGIIGKNTSSVYKFSYESTDAEMYAYAKTLVGICSEVGNSWGVCECGSNKFIDPANQEDTDTYLRAVFLGRMFINFSCAGATNMKYWVLNDVWYGDYVMNLGLWKLKDAPFFGRPKPQYFTWSLITSLTAFGSEIYPVSSTSPYVSAVAFRLPSGERTYFISNCKDAAEVTLTDKHLTGGLALYRYVVEEGKLPARTQRLESDGHVAFDRGTLTLEIPACSFVALSNKR